MAFDKNTQAGIKDTVRNLIARHQGSIDRYSDYNLNSHEAKRHAIVSVNQILSIVSTDWAIAYWSEVKRQIKSKI